MTETHLVKPTHPEASHLLEMLQSEYVGLYGEPDPNPDGNLDDALPPAGGVILLTQDGVSIAVGGWNVLSEGVACLRRMYVHYAHRSNGYSWTLLRAIENHARECGMERMVLETGTVQTAAIALYCAAGYCATEGFGFYAGQDTSVFLGRDL